MSDTLRHLNIIIPDSCTRPPETWESHVKRTVENIQHSVGATLVPKNRGTAFIPGNKTLH